VDEFWTPMASPSMAECRDRATKRPRVPVMDWAQGSMWLV